MRRAMASLASARNCLACEPRSALAACRRSTLPMLPAQTGRAGPRGYPRAKGSFTLAALQPFSRGHAGPADGRVDGSRADDFACCGRGIAGAPLLAAAREGIPLMASAWADAAPSVPADVASPAVTLRLYNTMSRAKEVFTAREGHGNRVGMYVCGVTPYDSSHIGHARAYVAFDVLLRVLRRDGYDVTYVRNFTDVDDKIISRAAASGESPLALAARFIDAFHADMAALGCLPPTAEPRVSTTIPAIIAMAERIVAAGHGYAAGGDVYFDVASSSGYGQLSRRTGEDNRAGERVAVDARKRSPADFALWKAAKEGEIAWDSPWGPGRPGWHIECSAMSHQILGPVVDIHGGGADLLFPHHENELAQSVAACPEAHVRYWMHNGFVTVGAGGDKMSKSAGNFFTVRAATAEYFPAALRWFLLGTHYRAPVCYTRRALEEASDRLYYFLATLLDADAAVAAPGETEPAKGKAKTLTTGESAAEGVVAAARSALADDLNTPAALAALAAGLKPLNDLLTTKAGRKAPQRIQQIRALVDALRSAASPLGLPVDAASAATAIQGLRTAALTRAGLTTADLEAAMADRAAARAAKDYGRSDDVRRTLESRGILLMDAAVGGADWRPAARLDVDEGGPGSP